MQKKFLLPLLLVSVLTFSACINKDKPSEQLLDQEVSSDASVEASDQANLAPESPKEYSYTAAVDGQTAFEVLDQNLDLEYKEYDFGVFIEGINGVMGDTEYYWAFYINDGYAEKGSKQTILKKGDIVGIKYEEVKNF